MLYEGKTVYDALAQALGKKALGRKKTKYPSKPSTYGKPIRGPIKTPSTGKVGAKPTNFGKQQEEQDNRLLTSNDLAPHRARAIRRARTYLANANYSFGSSEDGYAEIFLIDLQKVIELPGSKCGRAVTSWNGTPQWRYDFSRYASHPFYVLVFGHSHPDDSRNPSSEDRRRLCRPSRRTDGARSSDLDLYPYAPVVIGCQNNVREWNTNRSYRQWGQ